MRTKLRPPLRLDLLVTLCRLHREGVAARMTRDLVPTRAELLEIVQWESRAARELELMLDAHGWPGPALVGEVGAEAAWWSALLCDRQSVFQQRAHALLLESVDREDAPARHLAVGVYRVGDRQAVARGPRVRATRRRSVGRASHAPVRPMPASRPVRGGGRRRGRGRAAARGRRWR